MYNNPDSTITALSQEHAPTDKRRFALLLAGLTLLAMFVTLYRLDSQPLSGDDYGVALSAIQYVENGQLGPAMWNHPALRNILVYLSLKAFGPGVMGVKLWSILFGSLTAPLLAAVAYRLFRTLPIAALAGFFMALDPVRIDFSRQGINDVYLAFFPLAGLFLVLIYLDSRRAWQMIAAGVMFGCGLASKWSVALQLFAAIGYFFCVVIGDKGLSKQDKVGEVLFAFSSLILLPVTVYLFTFIPWFARGYSLSEWWELQGQMWLETRTHTGYLQLPVERDHRAYEWFIKPVSHVTYILPPVDAPPGEGVRFLLSFGNPLVWLLTLPGLAWLSYSALRQKNRGYLFAVLLFLVSYVPFVMTSRFIWVNTALAVIPYAFILVAFLVHTACNSLRVGRYLLVVYLLLVTLATVPLFLLATARGGDYSLLRPFTARYLPDSLDLKAFPGVK